MADWKSRATPIEEAEQPKSSWKDRAEAVKPEVSKTESGLRGAAQGLSFGFADEATGAAEAALDWLKNDPQGFMDNYRKHRDESRANYKSAEEANPKTYMAGQVAGAIAPALATGGLSGAGTAATLGGRMAAGALAGAAQGAAQGLGSSEADLTHGDVAGAARDTAIGAGLGGTIGGFAPAVSAGISKGAQAVGNKLDDIAENLAVKSTGATGAQASKFAPDTGRELLDRGIVKFGRSAEGVSKAAQEAMDQAGSHMDEVLSTLDQKGVKASADNVVAELRNKISQLSKDPSQASVVRKLEGIVDDIIETGQSNVLPSEAEATKRGFNKMAGNWLDPEKGAAGKTAYGAYKNEVERVAQQADPALAQKFLDAKKTYGILSPVQEAAEKRAMQQAQAPIFDIGDVVGAGAAGPKGIALNQAKKFVGGRMASMGAKGADWLSQAVQSTPQMFGKYAQPLQEAAKRGGTSLAATHYVLQQTNPEYREMIKQNMENQDEQEQ